MKLWLLVNSPCVDSVRWDARGEGLFIDQRLFEQELLGVGPSAAGEEELFKTKNFGSIVRQLNLYGFHKLTVSPASSVVGPRRPPTAGGDTSYADGPLHHFWNPHFRFDRPDLLVKIRRLTKANKEKLDAGLEVTSRLPDDLQYITGRGLAAAVAHVPRRGRKDRTFPVAELMYGHVFSLEKRDVSWMSNKTERQGRSGGACQACKGRSRDISVHHTIKEEKQNSHLNVCNRQGFLV
ncbi:PREDICTED: heat shock factor protein 5-like [Ficedula albicollis]|uniref:heat shock factor protein 5-like n=1 Tax=Ficedula albicollis TaxID=59894 RepID=UPI000359382E|nr:PREDICTED: heat shock factor protein 5-like [Ficedula albicollis]